MTRHTDLLLPSFAGRNKEPAERTYRALAHVVRVVMPWLGTTEGRDFSKLPQTGGIICVGNHISHFDPLVLGLARACGQIPVERGSVRAADSLLAAEAALDHGKAVALYPEGTLTGDPDEWPMSGRTGAARLALDTRVPVIPFGQWGAQAFMPDGKKGFPLVLGRRHRFQVICGDPVDLTDLYGLPTNREVLEAATTRIMDAITALVAELREQEPPVDPAQL